MADSNSIPWIILISLILIGIIILFLKLFPKKQEEKKYPEVSLWGPTAPIEGFPPGCNAFIFAGESKDKTAKISTSFNDIYKKLNTSIIQKPLETVHFEENTKSFYIDSNEILLSGLKRTCVGSSGENHCFKTDGSLAKIGETELYFMECPSEPEKTLFGFIIFKYQDGAANSNMVQMTTRGGSTGVMVSSIDYTDLEATIQLMTYSYAGGKYSQGSKNDLFVNIRQQKTGYYLDVDDTHRIIFKYYDKQPTEPFWFIIPKNVYGCSGSIMDPSCSHPLNCKQCWGCEGCSQPGSGCNCIGFAPEQIAFIRGKRVFTLNDVMNLFIDGNLYVLSAIKNTVSLQQFIIAEKLSDNTSVKRLEYLDASSFLNVV